MNFFHIILGIEPGTLVISEEVVDGLFRSEYRQVNLRIFFF
jgi:hypothetical protein